MSAAGPIAVSVSGTNNPPLADQLDLEIEADRLTADKLVKTVGESIITDDATAEKVRILAAQISAHKKAVEDRLADRVKPHQAVVTIIRAKYNSVIGPLDGAYRTLRSMLDTYVRRRAADAALAKAAAEAEAEAREAEARRAREEADEAQTSGNRLLALQKEEEAAAAAARADAIRPRPIRTPVGSVGQTREPQFEIQNLGPLLTWMRHNCRTQIEEAARVILARHLRGLGVNTVEKGVEIPGARVWIGSKVALRS